MRTTTSRISDSEVTFNGSTQRSHHAGIIVDSLGRAPFVRGSSKRNDALERSEDRCPPARDALTR